MTVSLRLLYEKILHAPAAIMPLKKRRQPQWLPAFF